MDFTSNIPDPEERRALVFGALRELIQSDVFRRSARIIRFLEYVALESLSEIPRLTEKSIGIEVFDRAEDWDPKLDPIVRIEARRLRDKLGQYYSSVPTEQALVMHLPKGGYRVHFEWHRPSVAVLTSSQKAMEWSVPETDSEPSKTERGTEPSLRPPTWTRPWFWLSTVLLILSLGAAAMTLSSSAYRVVEDRSIRVNSFRVDSRLSQEIDGMAVAGKLADQIRQLQQNTRATWVPPPVEDSWSAQRDAGWSDKIKDSLRGLTGSQGQSDRSVVQISGSIETSGADEITLYIRGGGVDPKTFVGKKIELPGFLRSASEYIFGACQPSSYSVYLTEHGRPDEAGLFTSYRYPKAQQLGDRVQLLYSWATAMSQEGNHNGAIEKYKLIIQMAPQSWGSYEALQEEYQAIGDSERSLDTGRQLEARAHRGSWWFELLPPRLFRHPGPDAFMETDELRNDYISLKQSIEVALKTHEAGAELLPLYSSYAQVLSRLHERSNAHLQLGVVVGRQEHGAAEGDLIYTTVILAREEQNDVQLRATLAQYRDRIKDTGTRASLAIEGYAACELMAAYEGAGDKEMSDLLYSYSDKSADCLLKRGEVLVLRGDINQAHTLYQDALVNAPSIPSVHYEYGLFFLREGDSAGAKKEFNLAHLTGPHWAEPLEMLAELAVQQGDLKTGLNLYSQASLCAPSWGHLYIQWADALIRDGKPREAAAKLQQAFPLDLTLGEEATLKQVSHSIDLTIP